MTINPTLKTITQPVFKTGSYEGQRKQFSGSSVSCQNNFEGRLFLMVDSKINENYANDISI